MNRYTVFFLIGLLYAAAASGTTVTAHLSRNPVAIDETFELTFQADGTPDSDPDFRPLEEDFDILNRSQSQNVQIINGRASRQSTWHLTLMAKREGNLRIPAVDFGSDRSNAVTVRVQAAAKPAAGAAGENLFLEVTAKPESAYIRQQLVIQVRLFRAVDISDASLTPLRFNDPDAFVEQLGEEQNFKTRRQGKSYLVSEINYAVFPQRSGTLTLEPLMLQARINRNPRRRDPFGLFGPAGPIKRIRSNSLSIEIAPIPKSADEPWLPATHLQLSEDWPEGDPEFRVGEPITRTLVLLADGLASTQLPPLENALPSGFKQYPDQPVLDDRKSSGGMTGIRQEKIALVPTRPGSYTLPEIRLAWWNTKTNRPETARIPQRQVQILPAVGDSTASSPPSPTSPAPEVTPQQPPPTPAPAVAAESPFFRWFSLFLACGWLATALAWWRFGGDRGKKPASAAPAPSEAPDKKRSLANLREACLANDPYRARPALLEWGACHCPQSPPPGLAALAARLDEPAAQEICALDRVLYGREGESWEGSRLWEAVKNLAPETKPACPGEDPLTALYPS